MERYSEPTHILPETLPQVLKPLLLANRIFGTFPYKVTIENGRILLSSKSFHYYYSLLAFSLILIPTLTSIYRSAELIISGPSQNGSPILGKMIEHLMAFYANFVTAISLGLLFLNRKKLARFFNGIIIYSKSIREYMDVEGVQLKVRKLFILYLVLASISVISIGSRYFENPNMGPLSVLFELTGLDLYLSPEIRSVLTTLFVAYLTLAKFSCLGYVEIVTSALATCFSRVIENLCEHLENQMDLWRRQFKGLARQVRNKDDFLNLLSSSPIPRDSKTKLELQHELDSYINQINELNPGLISPTELNHHQHHHHHDKNIRSNSSGLSSSALKIAPGKALCHVARKFQNVASMLAHTNAVFGLTLAINMGCIVAMSVILKYLIITNISADWKAAEALLAKHSHKIMGPGLSNVTLDDLLLSPSNDTTLTLEQSDHDHHNHHNHWHLSELDDFKWLMFLGVDITMLIRMGVVTVSLGRVHGVSLQFNNVMGKAYLAATQLIDEFSEVLATVSEDGSTRAGLDQLEELTRTMVTPTQTSSLLAFMNLYNAHPVAFSAGGLFTFSRGLILMIFSIIVSYLVFLLQAK